MACKVGITTEIKAKKKRLEEEFPTLSNWLSRGPYSKLEAQQHEKAFAKKYGCDDIGIDPEAASGEQWHLYYFEHEEKK